MRDDSAVVSNQTYIYYVIGPARDRPVKRSQTIKIIARRRVVALCSAAKWFPSDL
jgi:hypothetical protein